MCAGEHREGLLWTLDVFDCAVTWIRPCPVKHPNACRMAPESHNCLGGTQTLSSHPATTDRSYASSRSVGRSVRPPILYINTYSPTEAVYGEMEAAGGWRSLGRTR